MISVSLRWKLEAYIGALNDSSMPAEDCNKLAKELKLTRPNTLKHIIFATACSKPYCGTQKKSYEKRYRTRVTIQDNAEGDAR